MCPSLPRYVSLLRQMKLTGATLSLNRMTVRIKLPPPRESWFYGKAFSLCLCVLSSNSIKSTAFHLLALMKCYPSPLSILWLLQVWVIQDLFTPGLLDLQGLLDSGKRLQPFGCSCFPIAVGLSLTLWLSRKWRIRIRKIIFQES